MLDRIQRLEARKVIRGFGQAFEIPREEFRNRTQKLQGRGIIAAHAVTSLRSPAAINADEETRTAILHFVATADQIFAAMSQN